MLRVVASMADLARTVSTLPRAWWRTGIPLLAAGFPERYDERRGGHPLLASKYRTR